MFLVSPQSGYSQRPDPVGLPSTVLSIVVCIALPLGGEWLEIYESVSWLNRLGPAAQLQLLC